MTAALITATSLGVGGLAYCALLGFGATAPADVLRHASLSIFFTLVTLLAHSMTMFYLIGKGKAIPRSRRRGRITNRPLHRGRSGPPSGLLGRHARDGGDDGRAILGGGADTGAIPTGVHTVFAVSALVANVLAFRVELTALLAAAQAVTDVNQLLQRRDSPVGPAQ